MHSKQLGTQISNKVDKLNIKNFKPKLKKYEPKKKNWKEYTPNNNKDNKKVKG